MQMQAHSNRHPNVKFQKNALLLNACTVERSTLNKLTVSRSGVFSWALKSHSWVVSKYIIACSLA